MSAETLRILLVDDEPAILRAILMATEMGGWEARNAESAEAAITMIHDAMPDVIISDKNMPGMSGVDLLRYVRDLSQDVSFHLLTGYGNAESAREAIGLDIDGYIQKPFRNVFSMLQDVRKAHQQRSARNTRLRAAAEQRLHACVAVEDAALRAKLVQVIGTIDDLDAEITAAGDVQNVSREATVVLTDPSRLAVLQTQCPLSLLAVVSDDIAGLDRLIDLAEQGVSVISKDVPEIELRAQLMGLFMRAKPMLTCDSPTRKVQTLPAGSR